MIGKPFNDLYKLLKLGSAEDLENKKARLFPGGKLKVEDEVVTCSIFLATLVGISEFNQQLLCSLGDKDAQRITNQTAQLHAYTEIAGEKDRPDGLLVLTTGKKDKIISWAAYVEVKTKAHLTKEQIELYLTKTKQNKVPALITISNDFVTHSNISPTGIINKNLYHWSWKWVRSELFQLATKDSICDEDQVYLAQEFIKYLSFHSDIKDFSDMGENWSNDTELLAKTEKISKNCDELSRTVEAWCREEKDISIKLSECYLENIGCHRADLLLTKEEQKTERKHFENLKDKLINNKELVSHFLLRGLNPKLFKNEITKKLELKLIFRGLRLEISLVIPAKENAKAVGQTTFLLEQLRDAGIEDEIKIIANFGGRKRTSPATLKKLQYNKEYSEEYSFLTNDFKKESVKEFTVFYEQIIGSKFHSRKQVISIVETAIEKFYREVPARFM